MCNYLCKLPVVALFTGTFPLIVPLSKSQLLYAQKCSTINKLIENIPVFSYLLVVLRSLNMQSLNLICRQKNLYIVISNSSRENCTLVAS